MSVSELLTAVTVLENHPWITDFYVQFFPSEEFLRQHIRAIALKAGWETHQSNELYLVDVQKEVLHILPKPDTGGLSKILQIWDELYRTVPTIKLLTIINEILNESDH